MLPFEVLLHPLFFGKNDELFDVCHSAILGGGLHVGKEGPNRSLIDIGLTSGYVEDDEIRPQRAMHDVAGILDHEKVASRWHVGADGEGCQHTLVGIREEVVQRSVNPMKTGNLQ